MKHKTQGSVFLSPCSEGRISSSIDSFFTAESPLARELFHSSLSDSKSLSVNEDTSSTYSDLVCGELFIRSPRSPKRCSIQDLV